jgi:hypothetical protein
MTRPGAFAFNASDVTDGLMVLLLLRHMPLPGGWRIGDGRRPPEACLIDVAAESLWSSGVV